MPRPRSRPWQRDPNQTASEEPGTVQFGRDRYVTVLFPLDETTSEYVSAWFIDAGTPEEPRAAERERLIDRARALLRKVGRPPRSA